MRSIHNSIVKRISGLGKSAVFTTSKFLDLGTREAVDKALSRLAVKGTIRRLARGVYDYPKTHPVIGVLSPTPDQIAKALASRDRIRLQMSGAYAANILGLSTQVPAKPVYLTDGPSRTVNVGGWNITFVHKSPRQMVVADRISGLVIQALSYWGRKHVNDTVIQTLQRSLTVDDKKQLAQDIIYAPVWMGAHLRAVAGELI
jgi:hypothetical protein